MAHRYKAKSRGWTKAKRQAAGRKGWRTKVRRFGSKAAAIAASFGRRGKAKRGAARKARGGGRTFRRFSVTTRTMTGKAILARIQAGNWTTGLPPTEAELTLVRKIIERARAATSRTRFGAKVESAEERRRAAWKEKIRKEKESEAARRAAAKTREEREKRAQAERERVAREEAAAVEAELRSL